MPQTVIMAMSIRLKSDGCLKSIPEKIRSISIVTEILDAASARI